MKVMQGIHLLNKHQVEWNAMAVVNDYNADYPLEFYHFFKELGCHYIQFTPIVERIHPHADGRHLAHVLQKEEKLADFSVSPEQWGNFLCTIFDEWVKMTWENTLSRFLMLRWPTGWELNRAYVPWLPLADMQG